MILIKIGRLGDYILMTPALRALRETYPHACIDCVVKDNPAREFLTAFGLLDTIMVLGEKLFRADDSPPSDVSQRLTQLNDFGQHLRSKQYDAALLFHHIILDFDATFFAALLMATGAKYSIGLDGGRGSFLHVRVPDAGFGARHEAEHHLAVVAAVGAVVREKRLFLPINDELRRQAKAMLASPDEQPISRPLIAMHPGCGHAFTARRWPPEHFALLADQLYQQCGGHLLLVGGPEEVVLRERVLQMMHSAMPRRSLAGTESFFLAAAIIEQCDLFLGNDSGLMHAAAAVNTPTLGIFGLTNPQAWAPYMPMTPSRCGVVHRHDLSCLPCHYTGFHEGNGWGCATRHCLTHLQVETVADAARQLLYQTY
jgi:heptosyltransferase-2